MTRHTIFLENRLGDLTAQRDSLAADIRTALHGAEFEGTPVDPGQAVDLLVRGDLLLRKMDILVGQAQ